MSYPKAYIHKFSDGNICRLVLSVDQGKPYVSASWVNPPDWNTIETEYKEWRNGVAQNFLEPI